MEFTQNVVKAGKDDKGVYFIVNFSKDATEKVYTDEFFESQIESGKEFDVSVRMEPDVKGRKRGFHDDIEINERNRMVTELELKTRYTQPDPELNAFKYLLHRLEKNPPAMGWKGSSIADHENWSRAVRSKLAELIDYERERVPLDIKEGPRTTYKDIDLQKIYLSTGPGIRAVGILAKPRKIEGPLPAIVALHGHNVGKINSIGLLPSGSESYQGIELALRGFVTFSLDQWGWGERTGRYKKIESKPEETFSRGLLLLGGTALGIRAWDVSRALDYLETLDFVNGKFGVIGQSGGGAASTYSSALDERIHATVIAGHFCSMRYGLLGISHCTCAYVPRVLKYFDLPDIVMARAPKPTFIVSGEKDPLFPLEGVLDGYKKLEAAYTLYNKPENLGKDIIEGKGHFFRGKYAYPWLEEKLELHPPNL
ncbi:MAG: dienelactone hydrolase family protein [Candidatus Hodarchaeota archaeon]